MQTPISAALLSNPPYWQAIFSLTTIPRMPVWAFFSFFELHTLNDEKLYALIKYDNEDVVRYVLDVEGDEFQVPKLERFRESFVKKPKPCRKSHWYG